MLQHEFQPAQLWT